MSRADSRFDKTFFMNGVDINAMENEEELESDDNHQEGDSNYGAGRDGTFYMDGINIQDGHRTGLRSKSTDNDFDGEDDEDFYSGSAIPENLVNKHSYTHVANPYSLEPRVRYGLEHEQDEEEQESEDEGEIPSYANARMEQPISDPASIRQVFLQNLQRQREEETAKLQRQQQQRQQEIDRYGAAKPLSPAKAQLEQLEKKASPIRSVESNGADAAEATKVHRTSPISQSTRVHHQSTTHLSLHETLTKPRELKQIAAPKPVYDPEPVDSFSLRDMLQREKVSSFKALNSF